MGVIGRRGLGWLVVLVVVVAMALGSSGDDGDASARERPGKTGRSAPPETPEREQADDKDGGRGEREPRGGSGGAGEQSDQRDPDARPTRVVVRVVDGDTVELGDGETVRLVGIDTPEVGECGYERAARRLEQLVLGRQVRLGESDEDRDGYGRLLRYVDAGELDAGLQLIREGLAIARYDSRDGYGFHPREHQYVAADRGTRPAGCPAGVPQPLMGGGGSGGDCAPGYAPCVPSYPPDLDCADVGGPVSVSGSDPHALDGDGDGRACE